jgi:hypothetical protein
MSACGRKGDKPFRGPEPECGASKADGRKRIRCAAFEGTFLLLIFASELCAQFGKMEGPEAGARPQAEALIKRVGNDREKLDTACSETKEVVARWTRITLSRL